MASPQAENGHVRIATDLFEAECKVSMSGQEWQVYRFIQRKTWGWGKKSDAIPLMQIVKGTGVQKPRVCEALKALKERRMIVVRKNGLLGTNVLEIQKDFELWRVVRKSGLVRKSGTGGTLKRNPVVRKSVPSITTSNSNSSITKPLPPEALRLSGVLADLVLENYAKTKTLQSGTRPKTVTTWAADIDKLERLDGYTWEQIEWIIRWSQQDHFWKANIRSGSTLRQKFEALVLKAKAEREKPDQNMPQWKRDMLARGPKP